MPVFSFIAFFAGVFWKGGQLTTIIYTNAQCLWQQRWGDEISQPGGGGGVLFLKYLFAGIIIMSNLGEY